MKTPFSNSQRCGELLPDLAEKTDAEIAQMVAAHGAVYRKMCKAVEDARKDARFFSEVDACENWRNIIDALYAGVTFARDRIEVSFHTSVKQTEEARKDE